MMKWFRKHNKQLLAVFASALLVVWLGGQAFENMFRPDPRKATVGTAYGQKLTAAEFGAVRQRLELLQSMGILWQAPWRNPWVLSQLSLPEQRLPQDPIMMAGARPLSDRNGPMQWWLLEQEARRMGVAVSQDEVQRFIAQSGMSGERLTQIRDQMNVSTDEMFGAIADYLRVSYAAVLASAGVQVTDPEVKDVFVRTNDKVSIRYALLPYEAFEPKDAAASQPLSDAELQDLFKQYKDNLPGAGKYGFGYKIPDRVSIQYVGASVDDIVKTLPPVSEDRARKYFEAHRDKFQPARPPTTQPTTQPAVKFEEVKDRVIEEIRQEEAANQLRTVMEEIRASAFSEYTGSKAELDAGKAPDSLRNVLEERRNDFATSRKLPLVYRQTGLISQEEAGKEPGIGSASVPGNQGQAIRFADYAFNVDKAAAKDEQKPGQQQEEEAAAKLKLYQPQTVRDEMGGKLRGMYVFRVVKFEDAHAPASLEEVKDKVEHDAKILRAYKQADEAAQKLLAAAKVDGLKAAFAAQFPALATRPATTQPTASRPATPEVELFEQDAITQAHAIPGYFVYFNDSLTFPTRLLGVQDAEPLLKASFAMTSGPSSQPAAGSRVSLVELPSQKAYAVVEVTSHSPASAPDFAKAKPDLVAQLRVQKLRNFYAAWYNPDQIEKRAGWQSRQGEL